MTQRKKKLFVNIGIVLTILIVGITGFLFYTTYKTNQIPEMSFEQMLSYTTKNNKDAIISVGIIENGVINYTVYGENMKVITQEEHFYEIGSITKTFTSALIAKAVIEGKLDLNDRIDTYLELPNNAYYPTIESLLTHTSGYKNYYFEVPMVSNFFKSRNDFYGIDKDILLKRIKKIERKDKEYSFKYSNFGMAVLGLILEEVYDEDYDIILNSHLQDIGLLNTKIYDKNDQNNNFWEWERNDAYMPAGAMNSTISDMLNYANMQLEEDYDVFAISHEEIKEVNATERRNAKMNIHMDAMAWGWVIDKQNNIIWHNGATGNYNSYIGFNKEEQKAVIILSNLSPRYRIPTTVMGIALLNSL